MILALAAGALLGAVPVDTIKVAIAPEARPCTVEVLRSSFAARLARIAVTLGQYGSADEEAGALQVQLRQAGRVLELRVRGPGMRELVREIPGPGNDCLGAGETAALIVERYLDELKGGAELPGTSLTPFPPPPPPERWGVAVEAAVTAELGVLPQPARGDLVALPAVGVGGVAAVGVRHGRWQLSARGTLEPAGATAVAGSIAEGTLHLQAWAVALALAYHLPIAVGSVRFELSSGVQLFQAGTTSSSAASNLGAFGHTRNSLAALPFVGGGVGYQLPLWKQLSALAEVAMRVHIGTTALEVEGVSTDTVFTRQVDGEASLGLGYVFY